MLAVGATQVVILPITLLLFLACDRRCRAELAVFADLLVDWLFALPFRRDGSVSFRGAIGFRTVGCLGVSISGFSTLGAGVALVVVVVDGVTVPDVGDDCFEFDWDWVACASAISAKQF